MSLKIDVGGGKYCREGFINVDPFYPNADVKAPMWDMPYVTGTVSEVNCSHALEHVEKRKVAPALREFYRVLKPGGLLVLEVPDLVWCCENWLKTRDNGWNMDAIFGNQDDPGQFHMTGFTLELVYEYLRAAGFVHSIKHFAPFTHNQRCIHVEVFK